MTGSARQARARAQHGERRRPAGGAGRGPAAAAAATATESDGDRHESSVRRTRRRVSDSCDRDSATPHVQGRRRLGPGYHTSEQVSNQEPPDSRPSACVLTTTLLRGGQVHRGRAAARHHAAQGRRARVSLRLSAVP